MARLPNSYTLAGETFGLWRVLERAGSKHGHAMYQCRCQCGFEAVVPAHRLRAGLSRSCKKCADLNRRARHPIVRVGDVFGHWTVRQRGILQTLDNGGSRQFWICQCNCGRTRSIRESYLRKGTTKACRDCLSKFARARARESLEQVS